MANKESEVILPIHAMSSLNLNCNNESKCSSSFDQEYSSTYNQETTDLHYLNRYFQINLLISIQENMTNVKFKNAKTRKHENEFSRS